MSKFVPIRLVAMCAPVTLAISWQMMGNSVMVSQTNILCLLLSEILDNPATFFLQIQMNVPMTQIVVLKHA